MLAAVVELIGQDQPEVEDQAAAALVEQQELLELLTLAVAAVAREPVLVGQVRAALAL